MMEIHFKKSDCPIGALSVTIPGAEDKTYIWFFRNIYFYVRGMDTDVDIEAFARRIQLIAESGVVEELHSHLPRIEKIEIVSPVVNAHKEFLVRWILDADDAFDPERYCFDFRYNEQALTL